MQEIRKQDRSSERVIALLDACGCQPDDDMVRFAATYLRVLGRVLRKSPDAISAEEEIYGDSRKTWHGTFLGDVDYLYLLVGIEHETGQVLIEEIARQYDLHEIWGVSVGEYFKRLVAARRMQFQTDAHADGLSQGRRRCTD